MHAKRTENLAGLKSPLVGRLWTGPIARPSRQPWCGECDQARRMLDFDGAGPHPARGPCHTRNPPQP